MKLFRHPDAMANPRSSIAPENDTSSHRRAGRPRADSLSERRRLLLDASRHVFVERGYGEATLADIARGAHVALRTIYLQYGGKQGLLLELIKEEDALHCRELAALRLEEKDFREQLACLAMHAASRTSRPGLLRLYTVVQASADRVLVDAFSRAGPDRIRSVLDGVLRPALGSTTIHGMHTTESLCDHFIACVTPARTAPVPEPDAAVDHARRGLDLFLRILPP